MPPFMPFGMMDSMYGQMPITYFKQTPCGAYLPKRSMVIKNKRKRAHLARTRRK